MLGGVGFLLLFFERACDNTEVWVGAASMSLAGRKFGGESVAEKEQFRTWRASSVAVVFAQVAAAGKLDCVGAHIEAARNDKADKLSRRAEWPAGLTVRAVVDGFGPLFVGVPVLDLERDGDICALRELCRPDGQEGGGDEAAFTAPWRAAAAVTSALCGRRS